MLLFSRGVSWLRRLRFRQDIGLRRVERQLDGSFDIREHLVASVEPHGELDTFNSSPGESHHVV